MNQTLPNQISSAPDIEVQKVALEKVYEQNNFITEGGEFNLAAFVIEINKDAKMTASDQSIDIAQFLLQNKNNLSAISKLISESVPYPYKIDEVKNALVKAMSDKYLNNETVNYTKPNNVDKVDPDAEFYQQNLQDYQTIILEQNFNELNQINETINTQIKVLSGLPSNLNNYEKLKMTSIENKVPKFVEAFLKDFDLDKIYDAETLITTQIRNPNLSFAQKTSLETILEEIKTLIKLEGNLSADVKTAISQKASQNGEESR